MNIDFFVLLLQTQFDITVASEIMAILALTTDLQDMRKRFALYMFLFSCRIPLTSEHTVCVNLVEFCVTISLIKLVQCTLDSFCHNFHAIFLK